MVPVAPALGLQCFEHLVHDGRDRQGHSVLPARCKGYTQILVVQFYPETRLEVVREELLLFASITALPANPPESASNSFSGATPPLEPNTSASETASMVSATTIWLQALTT